MCIFAAFVARGNRERLVAAVPAICVEDAGLVPMTLNGEGLGEESKIGSCGDIISSNSISSKSV